MAFVNLVSAHYEEKGPIIWLAFFLEVIAAITLFALMLLTCADVAGRYFFSNSVDGTTELTEIAIAIIVFAEMPIVTWRGGHVVVDILDRVLGHVIVKVLGLVAALIMSTALYFLANRIFFLAARSFRREEVTEFLQIPTGLIIQYIGIMSWVTAAAMITYGIYRILFLEK